ncbi:MAG: DEAD/DEAH box helicase [Bacteroidales bacterium]|nr:DEAD/DEAH box helicase [Bacteroidales bacterium]
MSSFQELGLKPELLQAVEALGFKEPMPVQAAVIPSLIEQPSDIVGLAQTGTGKTAAFGLPLLQFINPTLRQTQAVILCPTRELCMQITRDLTNFARFMPGIKVIPIYGGASIEQQIRYLNDNPQIIVATPGRMNDMIRRGKVNLTHVSWAVLDEADEMLDMGFQDDVDSILQEMPKEKHTLLFSATMPDEVERILSKYMHSPQIKSVGERNTGTANVKHIYYLVQAKDRYAALKRVADFYPNIYAIVFCRTRIETQEIADSLIRDGYNADALHGDLSQAQRDHVMKRFRTRNLQMLVATDVAARGLDVTDLTHVINYNLPDEPEVYIHRSGRTGRADKTGISISIINLKEKGKMKLIEKKVGREFAKAKVPTGVQVCEKQLFHHIDRMENVEVNHDEIDSFLPVIYRKLEWMDRQEIIKRFVALEFNRFLDYYRHAADLNVEESKTVRRDEFPEEKQGRGRKGSWRDGYGSKENFVRMFFSMGRRDKIGPHHIIGIINEVTRSRDVSVGRIDIMDHYSFVDVDAAHAEMVLASFGNLQKNPSGIKVEIAGNKPERTKKKKDRKTYPEHETDWEKPWVSSKKADKKTKKGKRF